MSWWITLAKKCKRNIKIHGTSAELHIGKEDISVRNEMHFNAQRNLPSVKFQNKKHKKPKYKEKFDDEQ